MDRYAGDDISPKHLNAMGEKEVGRADASSQMNDLGFDLPDEAWLDLIRESESVSTLGRIGPYELLEEVSRGAQGIVYRARQPNTKRDIALKRLVAGSFATAAMRSRFEREVETASSLNHPYIVTVYGMEFADGQPLLAMEWIDGRPIDEWAIGENEVQRPDVTQVLQMFVKVCDAVRHAHQHGVIHRDLKPSNILVVDEGEGGSGDQGIGDKKSMRPPLPWSLGPSSPLSSQPKILDFGLAKLSTPDGSANTNLTLTKDFVGTPAYASPEQVRGEHHTLDVRSDVYALGVILYQMLTGRLPCPVDRSLPELLEAIQHTEPDRPSSIRHALNREIDAIVLKTLAKDKAQRYQSLDALTADVKRYLSGEAVLAHPPSSMYQFRKLVKRHRLPFAFASILFVLLLSFGIVATILAIRLADKHQEAQTQAAIAQAVNNFLNNDLLRSADPARTPNPDIKVREVLDAASQRIQEKFEDQPLVRASVHETLGVTYRQLGLHESAEEHLEDAVRLRNAELGARHPSTLVTTNHLALLLQKQGRYDEAELLFVATLETRRQLLGEDVEDTLVSANNLAVLYYDQGRYDEAEALYVETLEAQRRALGENHVETLRCKNNLAVLHQKLGRYEEAERLYTETLEAQKRTQGEQRPVTLSMMNNLADLYHDRGRFDEAETLFVETLELRRRILGEEHPHTLMTMHNLGSLYLNQRRFNDAEPLLAQVLEKRRRVLGTEHADMRSSMQKMGQLHVRRGRLDEAEILYADALEIGRDLLGKEHPDTLSNVSDLAMVYKRQGRLDEAETLYVQVLEAQRRVLGEDHPDTLICLNNLAVLYDSQKHYEKSEPLHVKALEIRRRVQGPEHSLTLVSMSNLAHARTMLGRPEEAEPLHAATIAGANRALPKGHWYTGMYNRRHGQCLMLLKRYDEAESALTRAHEIFSGALGERHKLTVEVIKLLVELHESQGNGHQATIWQTKLENVPPPLTR